MGNQASLALSVAALLAASGCAQIAGLDEYGVGHCSADEIDDSRGGCVPVPDCAENELPVAGGKCQVIGVLDRDCGELFEPDPEAPGGCRPLLPDCQGGPLLGQLGARECTPLFVCEDPRTVPAGTVWVSAAATEPFVGTEEQPYKTISDAIAATQAGGYIQVKSGTYVEHVRIPHKLKLIGKCANETVVVGTDPTRPVIDIGPDAGGSEVSILAVRPAHASPGTHASAGIRVDGAEGITIVDVLVADSAGPGITFKDTQGPAGAAVFRTVVQRATGAAIAAYGVSSLHLADVRVLDTRTLTSGDQGYGIAIFPSAVLHELAAAPATPATPRHRSTDVKIVTTIVQGGSDAGILVEGSDVDIERTFITGIQPQRDGFGRGVVVRRRLLGSVTAKVTIQQSVIADTYDAGVRVDDAEVTIENTTIRGVGTLRPERPGDAPCYGNGVRARNSRALEPGETAPRVSIIHSLIEGTRESGVHVEGARALVEGTIIRDTMRDACEQFGDGIAAYDYDFSPAAMELRSSRIEAGPRAGVVSFGASLSLQDAVIDGCGARGALVGTVGEEIPGAETALCRCNGRWSFCAADTPELEPALIGFGGCNPETESCLDACFTDLIAASGGNPELVPDVSVWVHGRDDVASVVTNPLGCGLVPGAIQGSRGRGACAKRNITPAMGLPNVAGPPLRVTGDVALVPELAPKAVQTAIGREDLPDLRNAIYVAGQVCAPPEAPLAKAPKEVCIGHGVEGVRLELVGAVPPFDQPYFLSAVSSGTDPSVRAVTLNSSGFFYNVPPGEYVVRLLPPASPPGLSLACDLDPHATGVAYGIPVEQEPNAYRVRVEPAFNTFAVRAFCTVN